MMQEEAPRSSRPALLERLGVAEDPLVGADPVSLLRALASAAGGLVRNPTATAAANVRLLIGLLAAVRAAAGRTVGRG
jgi:hypothetical protein